jgi:phospholipid/cholesterol/gamma-HCH transport system substrate-binding protein
VDLARRSPAVTRLLQRSRRRLMGVAFLFVVGFLVWLATAFYNKTFVTTTPVTLKATHLGTQLSLGADVKLRGIIVGEVRKVSTTGDGATIQLALQPAKAKLIPQNVLARILPKTLFGQKFVDLVVPQGAASASLRSGDVIPQDRSANAIEVEKVLDDILPVLQSVDPQQLNVTLTNLANALEGRGGQLGQNLSNLDDYLRTFNQHLPALKTDISELASVADSYADASPDLLRFLDNASYTSRTISEKSSQLEQFLRDTTAFAGTATGVLTEDRTRLIQLGQVSAPILSELASRGSDIRDTVDGLAAIAPKLRQVFGTGSNENWLHISLIPVTPKGAYTLPNDCPKYVNKEGSQYGPNCGSGAGAAAATTADTGGATPVPVPAPTAEQPAVVGSPAEQKLITDIVGKVTRAQGSTRLSQSGVLDILLGPMLRGTTVTADTPASTP